MKHLNESINRAVTKVLKESRTYTYGGPIEIDVEKRGSELFELNYKNLLKFFKDRDIAFFVLGDNTEFVMDKDDGAPYVDYIESAEIYMYTSEELNTSDEKDPINLDEFDKIDSKACDEFMEWLVAYLQELYDRDQLI